MTRVHEDELDVDEQLVRALLREQFPRWAELPLERAGDGTVHVIYRLGAELSVRLPRRAPSDGVEERVLPVVAPHVPVEVPRPVARGRPGAGYPWEWAVHTWLDGELPDVPVAADDVGALLLALQRIDADGPEPVGGRGKPLRERDRYVRAALERVDAPGALELWEAAMEAPEWDRPPVWVHCDLDRRNVVVRDGRLTGVLDWGSAGIGDPAVDVQAVWKLVARDEHERFRELLAVDDDTWLRAKGWCVSQALIALGYYTPETNPPIFHEATRWLGEVLAG
ncbi:MAG TPA: aminoglycoside phosphotransferase family protein [Gaiellaceae bacterium]